MKKKFADQKGFTLVEIIVSLMLVGVIAVLAGMAVVPFIEGYVATRRNAEITQKAQLAMTRMVKEFTVVTAVTSGTNTAITFTAQHGVVTVTHTISWAGTAGNPLVLDLATNNDTLTDQVSNFQLTYIYFDAGGNEVSETTWGSNSQGINIQLTMQNATNIQHTARVFPRNL